jgi:FKBP-type peptidyl-prolyl cis-trans isomerase FkpA
MNNRVLVVLALAAAVGAGACGSSSPTTPSSPDQSNVPYSQTDLVVGTGAAAFSNSTVHMTYNLWLYSETATDHKGTFIEGNVNMQFALSNTIAGWRQGVAGMKVGGQRRLIVPPAMAYGSTGSGNIPPNAALVFDVELVSIP